MSPAPDLWMKNYNLKEDNRDHPVEWSTNLTLLNYIYLLFSKKDSSFFVLLTMLSIEKYIWYFLRKRQVFLSLFLLTMFSRHCKLDLLHSLMLPPKGPALHIHLNNMKTRKITKRQWKKKKITNLISCVTSQSARSARQSELCEYNNKKKIKNKITKTIYLLNILCHTV